MAITRDEVAHLARLSRLALTDEELDRFAGQLDVTALARRHGLEAHVAPFLTGWAAARSAAARTVNTLPCDFTRAFYDSGPVEA